MKCSALFLWIPLCTMAALATGQTCDVSGYQPVAGFTVRQEKGVLAITWTGERGEELRAGFAIRDGQPIVRELAARERGGAWRVLGSDLTPDFQVTAGKRRISATQRRLLQKLGIDTPAEEDARKWNTFWDAPLVIPGGHDTTDLPRKPEEIQRASVRYHSDACRVSADGARVANVCIWRGDQHRSGELARTQSPRNPGYGRWVTCDFPAAAQILLRPRD